MPARTSYWAFHSSVFCLLRISCSVSCSACGRSVNSLGAPFARVHFCLSGQSRQSFFANLTLMMSFCQESLVGAHFLVTFPFGQVTFFACQSILNWLISKPSACLACQLVLPRTGPIIVTPWLILL